MIHTLTTAGETGRDQRLHLRIAPAAGRSKAVNRRAGCLRQIRRKCRMVKMGMGDENCLDPLRRGQCRQNRLQMCGIIRPGIDHRHHTLTKDMRHRPRPGHRRGIPRQHAAQPKGQGAIRHRDICALSILCPHH